MGEGSDCGNPESPLKNRHPMLPDLQPDYLNQGERASLPFKVWFLKPS